VVISGNETVGNWIIRNLTIQGGNIYLIPAGLPQSWTVDEPGTYRIVITNLSPTEPVEFTGSFQFTRNCLYRPYAKFGYVTFSLGLALPIVFLVNLAYNKLRRPESS
jgi:hypothetical protein